MVAWRDKDTAYLCPNAGRPGVSSWFCTVMMCVHLDVRRSREAIYFPEGIKKDGSSKRCALQ